MTDLHRLSIRELSEGLKKAQFSSRELTEHYLKRIAKIDPKVKSYVTVTAEQALIEADAADVALKSGHAHALAGFPSCQEFYLNFEHIQQIAFHLGINGQDAQSLKRFVHLSPSSAEHLMM